MVIRIAFQNKSNLILDYFRHTVAVVITIIGVGNQLIKRTVKCFPPFHCSLSLLINDKYGYCTEMEVLMKLFIFHGKCSQF